VKQRIDSELKLGDAAEQKLIYLGKILTNEQTVGEVKIKPNEMIVVMISKIKKPAAPAAAAAAPAATPAAAPATAAAATPAPAAAAAAAPAATTTPAATTADTPAQPAATPAAAPAAAPATATPAAQPAASSSLQNSAASNVAMGSAYEDSIVNLMSLGFERQQVVDALRAAYNNADRAAEYLFGPESVLRAALAQAGPAGGAPHAAAAPATPARAAQAPAQPAQAGGQGAPSADELVGMAGAAGVDAASLEQLRSVLQSNPALVPLLLQQVANGDPALVQQLGSDPAALQALLQGLAQAGGPAGAQGGGGQRRGQAIHITEAENQQLVNVRDTHTCQQDPDCIGHPACGFAYLFVVFALCV